jgi:hypothetical protein
MARGEPGLEALAGLRDRVGTRDPAVVEAERAGALDEGGLEALARQKSRSS